MPKFAKPSFPMELIWAAACAADRVNQGQYHKISGYRPKSEGSTDLVEFRSNRQLAEKFLADPNSITAEDRQLAEQIKQHYQGQLFNAIAGRDNEFLNIVLKMTTANIGGNYEVAVAASLPSAYRRMLKREENVERQQALAPVSEYIGAEGSRQTLKIRTLETFFSAKFNCHIVTAQSGTNLVKFFTAKDITDFAVGKEISIKGTVKRFAVNDRTGAKETWLNRVKVI